jgi:hypothetical protein
MKLSCRAPVRSPPKLPRRREAVPGFVGQDQQAREIGMDLRSHTLTVGFVGATGLEKRDLLLPNQKTCCLVGISVILVAALGDLVRRARSRLRAIRSARVRADRAH